MKTGGDIIQLSYRIVYSLAIGPYQDTISPSLSLLTDKRINLTIAGSGLEAYT